MFDAFRPRKARSHTARWAISLMALALLAASCGESGDDETKSKQRREGANVETGLAEAGDPVRGGRIVYGVEAETTGGLCLPESQLGPAGHLIRPHVANFMIRPGCPPPSTRPCTAVA